MAMTDSEVDFSDRDSELDFERSTAVKKNVFDVKVVSTTDPAVREMIGQRVTMSIVPFGPLQLADVSHPDPEQRRPVTLAVAPVTEEKYAESVKVVGKRLTLLGIGGVRYVLESCSEVSPLEETLITLIMFKRGEISEQRRSPEHLSE